MENNHVITQYSLIGCNPKCTHRGDNIIDGKLSKRQDKPWIEYLSVSITPICQNAAECSKYRQEIYNRADATKNNILDNGDSWKKATNAWNRIANEYRHNPCPFVVFNA
jgi:hypothetical protein